MPISCRDNVFTESIDHLVVNRRVLLWVDRTTFRQVTYSQADKAVWDRLSNYCPVLWSCGAGNVASGRRGRLASIPRFPCGGIFMKR
jgi:hypothetical protein